MKLLVAKKKDENKLRYYNGKMFVVGKSRAIDVSIRNSDETIQEFINNLYDYLETTAERGTIDYFVIEV